MLLTGENVENGMPRLPQVAALGTGQALVWCVRSVMLKGRMPQYYTAVNRVAQALPMRAVQLGEPSRDGWR